MNGSLYSSKTVLSPKGLNRRYTSNLKMRDILKTVLKANGSNLVSVLNSFYSHVIKFTDLGNHGPENNSKKQYLRKDTYSLERIKDLRQQSELGFPHSGNEYEWDVSSFIFLTFTEKQKCLKLNILNPFPIIESLLYS